MQAEPARGSAQPDSQNKGISWIDPGKALPWLQHPQMNSDQCHEAACVRDPLALPTDPVLSLCSLTNIPKDAHSHNQPVPSKPSPAA